MQHASLSAALRKHVLLAVLLILSAAAPSLLAQAAPDLSGTWTQDNARCTPPRKGNVTLRITEHQPELAIETTMLRASGGTPRHALQHYTLDGKPSVSTGADGDEFHTSIAVHDGSLVFTIEEHEDGDVLHSVETWTLIDGGSALQRVRTGGKGEGSQTLIYVRAKP
jgi:hypothetical protein